MTAREIPDSVRARQIAASNPEVSAWVAANAGSGKTHVLAQRVIRLLLQENVEPARILCITFTKAAAANMAIRVFDTLRKWTALDDTALDMEMRAIGVRTIDADCRARARKLFALTLETPGGLKVQTIHAFCTQLLHLFPFEARVAARFNVLDDAEETQLLDKLVLEVLLNAAGQPESPLGCALAIAVAEAADITFREVLNEMIGERDRLLAWIEAAGGVEAAIAQINGQFGIGANETSLQIEAAMTAGPLFPDADWPAAAQILKRGSKTDIEQAGRLETAKNAIGTDRVEAYLSVFFTAQMTPRKSVVTKAIEKIDTALVDRLNAERDRLVVLVDRQRAIAVRDRTAALITIAAEVLARFQLEKNRRGLLDYDDLIDKALALLNNTSAAWVHYKLDRGIDHVLIDEAQDTSPKQWDIVRALVAEFFAGAGAHTNRRTIFAVGDEKQSIFSFQGAAPREFDLMRREFEKLSKAGRRELHQVRLDHSFRAGKILLGAVNTVFGREDIFPSVTSEQDGIPPHMALDDAAPGSVEVWDTEKPAEKREILGWDAPFDTQTETSAVVRLARRIAKAAQSWQRQGRRPGEVLILVRQRGPLFEAIIRALKEAGVAVAGADRLVLTEHIAVMDLIALADALLLPDDELALATVLKSPLFGFDDDQLFRLAWNRKIGLRAALTAKARDDAKFAEAAKRIEELSRWAREETPFGFYARLLNSSTSGISGRHRFLARLGLEAADALDEFLNLALDYERHETPSLQGFVAWLRAAKSEVKRDMDIARDEVRVMTVHGAKGLEAPIVVLADTTSPPEGRHPPRLLALPAGDPGAPERLIWARRKDDDIGPMVGARAAALKANEDEYRRLLYVAMTRAAERLIVCGVEGERGQAEGCWYELVRNALADGLTEEPSEDGAGKEWHYRKSADDEARKAQDEDPAATPLVLPPWLARDLPKDAPNFRPIMPSRAFDPGSSNHAAGPHVQEKSDRAAIARLRGNLLHRLMQSLPDVAPELRQTALQRFLARAEKSQSLPATERDAIAAQVGSLFDNPQFADLFAPGSRAEVPIVGRLGNRKVTGQIDRLAVTADAVLIADYKTNRPAPLTPEDAVKRYPGYVAQLALYRAVLTQLYPGRTIRAALVWTEVPLLMEIPAPALDASLTALTVP